MRKTMGTLLCLLFAMSGMSQEQMVSYDYQNNIFNNNQDVPQGAYFSVTGDLPDSVSTVIFAVYRNHKRNKAVYSNTWRRPIGNASQSFSMPINYKLRGNNQFDFVFYYYKPVNSTERKALKNALRRNLSAYLSAVIQPGKNKIKLSGSNKELMNNLNQIVNNGLSFYECYIPGDFQGFSDLVEAQLDRLDGLAIPSVVDNQVKERNQFLIRQRNNLLNALMGEVAPYVNGQVSILIDSREIRNYPTESTSNYIALNIGYGAAYLSGGQKDFDYATAPYVGLSFPLGNRDFSKFWGNSSISVGMFLKNFKNKDGKKVTGPIVGFPYFVGVGYKFLHIFRAQAGAVATSEHSVNIQDVTIKDFRVKPFIGISAEINLWLGFNRNKK